jgi:predicted nucleic acid-binding Zn ribbon protein
MVLIMLFLVLERSVPVAVPLGCSNEFHKPYCKSPKSRNSTFLKYRLHSKTQNTKAFFPVQLTMAASRWHGHSVRLR